MRKLIGGLAILSTPLFATALLTGCQKDDAMTPAAEGVQGSELQEAAQLAPLGEKGQAEEIAKACGFECKSIAKGDVSISGIRSVDAFFAATITLQNKASVLEGEIKGTLGQMAAIVGAEVGASIDVTAANIAAKISGGFDGKINGGVKLKFQPPQCQVSAKATVEAAAKCDADVKPGMAEVKCEGSCEAEASAMATCEGELKCTGTAPSFKCEGSCTGTCELEAGAACEGTCSGSCEVATAADCDGEFQASTDQGGGGGSGTCKLNAGATCKGECKGSCELNAGGTCEGSCKGECEYTPPEGGCSGKAECKAEANAKVSCNGECKGNVEPPEVKAECKATAKADAQFNAECTPPLVGLDYELDAAFAADGSVDAKAEFNAKMEAFAKVYGELIAKGAQLEGILKATLDLPGAAAGAVGDAVAAVGGDANIQLLFDISCTVDQLPIAGKAITDARAKIQASFDAVATVSGSVAS